MSQQKKPTVGITMGDPAGIGPEVIQKALLDPEIRKRAHFIIVGDLEIFSRYQKKSFSDVQFLDLKNTNGKTVFGRIHKENGRASLEYLDTALSLLKAKRLSALVTGPVCKEAVQLVSKEFKGHTEYLADFFHAKKFEMMFVVDDLKIVVATRHLPLAEVSKEITKSSVYDTIIMTGQSLQNFFKIKKPRIAVCGLNPHAGEGGRIGKEEIKTIIPAIKRARKEFPETCGPFAADTLFCPFNLKNFDAVIAMYHDQGLIPIKAASFNKLVNFTLGLPVIRTSPAHGTAFDIAGTNRADPCPMKESIKLAAWLAR